MKMSCSGLSAVSRFCSPHLRRTFVCLWCLALTLSPALMSGGAGQAGTEPDFRADQILVKPRGGVDPKVVASLHAENGARVLRTFENLGGMQVISVPKGETAAGLIA